MSLMSIKKRLKQTKVIKDYLCFKVIYSECTSLWKYIKYQISPRFENNTYWPIHERSEVRGKIIIGKGARVGHRPGCVIQGRGRVFIGDYVGIAPNCMIISGNHDLYDQNKVVRKETIIGDYCWLASSSILLAGVVLGPRTIVGAGAVVTKSFPDGYCVLAGNPARVVKTLDKEKFVCERPETEFYGYIREDKFASYYEKYLSHIKFTYDLKKVTNNKYLIECLSTQ